MAPRVPLAIPSAPTVAIERILGKAAAGPGVPASPIRKAPALLTTRLVVVGAGLRTTTSLRNTVNVLVAIGPTAIPVLRTAVVVIGTIRKTRTRKRGPVAPVLLLRRPMASGTVVGAPAKPRRPIRVLTLRGRPAAIVVRLARLLRISEAVLAGYGLPAFPAGPVQRAATSIAVRAAADPRAIPRATTPAAGLAAAVTRAGEVATLALLVRRLLPRPTIPAAVIAAIAPVDAPKIPQPTPAAAAVIPTVTGTELDVVGATTPAATRSLVAINT